MINKEILVNLGVDSYKICIGSNILEKIGDRLRKLITGNICVIITNPKINSMYGDKVKKSLEKTNFKVIIIEVPEGEKTKSLENAKILYDKLIDNKVDRRSCIIALGGGVIGDLAGFVAATFARGVPFVQIPTTLLAQVDSSVGGKVAVNHPNVKNGIGVFYQPILVWIDIDTLKTLSDRDFKSGVAEIIKYSMIADSDLFNYLRENNTLIKNRNSNSLSHIIYKSCLIKKQIVEKDEKEKNLRMILNYGHSFGHAIENISNYQLRHGEAIAIGIICAADLAVKIGLLDKKTAEEQENLINLYGFNTNISQKISIKEIIKKMQYDKKKIDNKLKLVLPTSIGKVIIKEEIPEKVLESVIKNRLYPNKKSNFDICVTLAGKNEKEVLDSIKKAIDNGANLIELRLDLIKNKINLKNIINKCKVPIIITDRKNKENLLNAIEAGCDFIDIELSTDNEIRDKIVKKAKENECKVIISIHDYNKIPSYPKLLKILYQQKNAGADIGKIVTTAKSIEDCQKLINLSFEAKKIGFPILIFSMGNIGRFTRLIAPIIGSEFTYASLKNEIEPGQMSVASVKNFYKVLR